MFDGLTFTSKFWEVMTSILPENFEKLCKIWGFVTPFGIRSNYYSGEF